jgi:hypothetical protein
MHTLRFVLLACLCGAAARADFSYTMTRHSSGMAGASGTSAATKFYLKGQKMMTDMDSMAMIIDFDSQTVTSINKAQKTYTVTPFGQMAAAVQGTADVQADFKETGQRKVINGFNASQAIMTMQMEVPAAAPGMKMQMEIEFWISPDVPGAQELHAFYQRNMGRFPWEAVAGGGNPGMQKALVAMQKRMAEMNGAPVMEIIRVKRAGGGNDAQMQQMQAGMAQARARLEAMAQQPGPQGDAAKQALARMGGMSGGSGGALSETTMEASGFSSSSVPDSVFAVPAGFQKTDR